MKATRSMSRVSDGYAALVWMRRASRSGVISLSPTISIGVNAVATLLEPSPLLSRNICLPWSGSNVLHPAAPSISLSADMWRFLSNLAGMENCESRHLHSPSVRGDVAQESGDQDEPA